MEISTTPRRPARFFRVLVNVISVLTLLLAAGLVIPSALGMQRYVITGSSMSGTYELGSVVLEEVVPVNDLKVGDVITYMPPPESGIDHLVTHRIVSIKNGSYRTKGDAVGQVDPWTFRLDTVSQPRVKYSVPYVGYFFIAIQDRAVRIALIGVPAGIVALMSLLQVIGLLRPRRRRPPDSDAPATVEATGPTPASVSRPTASVSG